MTKIALAVIGAAAVAGCGSQQEGRAAHPHEERHGTPMTVAELQHDLIGMAFVDQSEETVRVSKAECVPGSPGKRRDIHQVCVLRFGSGLVADEVAVHVVEDGWIFYSDIVVPAIEP
jgi:hypothetical protein